ncbi:MAG: T9SS C-terminal target domain-containing protein [Flavobacteriales bacterium]
MNSLLNLRAIVATTAVVFTVGNLPARENHSGRRVTQTTVGQAKAGDCSPATQKTEIDLNNVRALIETGGNMWQDRSSPGGPAYEVPKTEDRSGPHALFAGSLWMGGLSPDNQLKLAAVRFRQVGNDFWPGPLTNDGTASIAADVCTDFDKTWKTNRNDVARHNGYYLCLNDPDCNVNEEFPGYIAPSIFSEWPAIGDVAAGQDLYIAPFNDFNGDGDYEPGDGDSPGYDLDGTIDCKSRFREDAIPLFGDENIWWVFNDNGNAHSESSGQPIGMEIRAQAFAFATNDEVNNMTFYNYVVINQGTQTLTNTYFGQWVDCDLGCANDDYVGCDVQRGLGYAYNGTDNDAGSACVGGGIGYGVQPPAIGMDFFEGPYQDADGVDNPLTTDCNAARAGFGIPYKGIGIGYGDTVVDNERYGMRAFLYHNNDGSVTGDPDIAIDYYNFLRAIWKDNSPNLYGGTGHIDGGGDPNTPAQYMFPGDSDPLGWGTNCVPQAPWSEITEGNPPADRRFIQSAGPFTLEPGAYNNITVGAVWARATAGGPVASVEEVRKADDKAQSLFDNCFKILNGPDAPELNVAELDRELILYINNPGNSNNNVLIPEDYVELDPAIPESATDRFYRFQGYLVYQVANAEVSASEVNDLNKARLIYQGDIEDGVSQLVNYNYDPDINLPVPVEMVNGADAGIAHSIRVTEDQFAQGDVRLINFKTYYFIAIAYGYNNYADYNPVALTGQAFTFKSSRKGVNGEIVPFSGIPHKPTPSEGGTIIQAEYGTGFPLVRLEGDGNGANRIELEETTIDAIMSGSPWRQDQLLFKRGLAPVVVKVIDPLNVPKGRFELWFNDVTPNDLADATWSLVALDRDESGGPNGEPDGAPDTLHSERSIAVLNEQLVPDWGLSVTVQQFEYPGVGDQFTDPIDAGSWTFAGDPWCYGVPDDEGENPFNWIRSGTSDEDGNSYNDYVGEDDEEVYEGILTGMWAPWILCGDTAFQPCSPDLEVSRNVSRIANSRPTLIVLTADKNRWTRCAVLENEENPSLAQGGVAKNHLRSGASVDKNGRRAGSSGANDNEATMNGTQPNGMGWFPGYAIDIASGERLNMAFSENSFWGADLGNGQNNGRDFLFNPDDRLVTNLGQPLFGGCHWIYVFGNANRLDGTSANTFMPQYDEGAFTYSKLTENSSTSRRNVFRSTEWVGSVVMAPGMQMNSVEDGLIPNESRIILETKQPYTQYVDPYGGYAPHIPSDPNGLRNGGRPLYTFSSDALSTLTALHDVAVDALDLIGIVPNPYYSFSGYETSRLDNRVKFVNLPQTCTISIYNVGGTRIRKYDKDNDLTFLDWDLRNGNTVPIAGGTYICHIDVPGVGEKVIKWFGVIRPVDLQNF